MSFSGVSPNCLASTVRVQTVVNIPVPIPAAQQQQQQQFSVDKDARDCEQDEPPSYSECVTESDPPIQAGKDKG